MSSAALRYAHRNDEAYAPAVEGVWLAPQDGYAWFQLAAALSRLRRFGEALEAGASAEGRQPRVVESCGADTT
jgi:hypothetical protein